MPIYEFKCPKCGHKKQVFTEMAKADFEQRCTKCGIAMRKLLGFGSVTFNGGGFYSTDKKSGQGG